ncbi:MAG: hypothetical protein WBR18_14335, partial [Anaerolineales bacterium]
MNHEAGLRLAIGLVFAVLIWMTTRYRRGAQRGETYDLSKEGPAISIPLRLSGILLWLYLPLLVLAPSWMAWS